MDSFVAEDRCEEVLPASIDPHERRRRVSLHCLTLGSISAAIVIPVTFVYTDTVAALRTVDL
jgi:hypothetical protein